MKLLFLQEKATDFMLLKAKSGVFAFPKGHFYHLKAVLLQAKSSPFSG